MELRQLDSQPAVDEYGRGKSKLSVSLSAEYFNMATFFQPQVDSARQNCFFFFFFFCNFTLFKESKEVTFLIVHCWRAQPLTYNPGRNVMVTIIVDVTEAPVRSKMRNTPPLSPLSLTNESESRESNAVCQADTTPVDLLSVT